MPGLRFARLDSDEEDPFQDDSPVAKKAAKKPSSPDKSRPSLNARPSVTNTRASTNRPLGLGLRGRSSHFSSDDDEPPAKKAQGKKKIDSDSDSDAGSGSGSGSDDDSDGSGSSESGSEEGGSDEESEVSQHVSPPKQRSESDKLADELESELRNLIVGGKSAEQIRDLLEKIEKSGEGRKIRGRGNWSYFIAQ